MDLMFWIEVLTLVGIGWVVFYVIPCMWIAWKERRDD